MHLKYLNSDHKAFFLKMISALKYRDVYHVVFFYLMGLAYDTINHISDLYDFRSECITPEKVKKCAWMTPGCLQICNLAFNLYGGYYIKKTADMFTPDSLFTSALFPYFVEALWLRYSDLSGLLMESAFKEAALPS